MPEKKQPINGFSIEALFDFEALTKGYIVSQPRTDTAYDRILDNNGKLFRVQIKARRLTKTVTVVRVSRGAEKRTLYTKTDIDVVALYIENNNSWYLIPVEVVKEAFRINIIVDKMDKYKNNWKIFR